MSLFVIGYPGNVGGANTECWHTVKLWRQRGLDVTLIPTWRPDEAWKRRLDGIGCRTVVSNPDDLQNVPDLRGAIIVSFCNSHFLRHAARFRELGCRIVWVGCMNWLFAEERKHYRRHGPFDRYVFQSDHQQAAVQPQLARFGVAAEQCSRIRGAFDLDEFPFRPLPHEPGRPLVVGRISRAAEDKFAANTWAVYRRIAHPIRARVMAWSRSVERKLGPPPHWAECLEADTESPGEFLGKLHCMIQINGGAGENWPRSGLEAMAAGVPVVAENRWGWKEMIRHGQTGYLADDGDELAAHASRLANDEARRIEIVHRARARLEAELANPDLIGTAWDDLFAGIS